MFTTTECCIEGAVVTGEMLTAYLRSWARRGVYVEIPQTPLQAASRGSIPVTRVRRVLHDSLTYRFSHGHPDAAKRGKRNEDFLCTAAEELVPPTQEPVVVFPLSPVYPTEGLTLRHLLRKLSSFLSTLPSGHRYALSVQNREYLLPAYFDCLREYSVAHAFCTGPTMPGLLDQAQLPYALTADMAVVMTEPSLKAEWQLGMMEIIRRCIDAGKEVCICLDAVPGRRLLPALAVLMERMREDLAKLSPLRAAKAA